jgi:hypothetical protein
MRRASRLSGWRSSLGGAVESWIETSVNEAESVKNLDRIVEDRDFDARVECSATWAELMAQLPAGSRRNIRKFTRVGLGTWQAVALEFADIAEVIVAAPLDVPEAGVSIWFGLSNEVGFRSVASAVGRLFPDDPPLFITSDGIQIGFDTLRANSNRENPVFAEKTRDKDQKSSLHLSFAGLHGASVIH